MNSNSIFANTDQTLVALSNGHRLPILGRFFRDPEATPIVPALTSNYDAQRALSALPVLDTKTNLVYSQKGLMTLEAYEESLREVSR